VGLTLLLRTGWQVWRISQLIYQSARRQYADFTLVTPSTANIATFSFFRYIILNPTDVGNPLIVQHERIHVRQWHSIDVLGMAVLRALFWPIPALWLFDRALRQVHEFLADRATVDQQRTQSHQYAEFLVDYAFGVRPESLTNGFFNPSLLKQRIQMLHRQATTRWALGKYLLLLPLSLALLAMTSVPHELETLVQQATEKTITVKGRVTSAADGKQLSGADIVVRGKQKGTSTDIDGLYVIQVASTDALVFGFKGFRTDTWQLDALANETKQGILKLNAHLQPVLEDELPAMGATDVYKAVKPNPSMPLRTVSPSIVKGGETFTATSEPATFPTGILGLMNYVAHSLRYPAKAKAAGIEGDVYVLFTVSPSGKVTDARVNESIAAPGSGCQEEAVRVVGQMPRWIPAIQQGKPVAVRYQIPIRFALDHGQKEQKSARSTPADTLPTKRTLWHSAGDLPGSSPNNGQSSDRYTLPLPDSLRLLSRPTATIRISSLLKGDPLYVVDGVMVENIQNLNPDQVSEITVLKDVSATATYGEKGKNGVILITTKKP
jgi:TonB family protein